MTNTTTSLFEDFTHHLDQRWIQTCIGAGSLSLADSVLHMHLPATASGQYADAQIDDYGNLARHQFPWRPPLRMEVRARSSLPAATINSATDDLSVLRGTAGFGFWNYPFSVRGDILMLPEAVWFFYASPPSNMALIPGIPGWGWKAQVIHTMRPEALLATIPTALSIGWGLLTHNSQPAARWLQRLSGAHEMVLTTAMTTWHTYSLEWRATVARFWVDGQLVMSSPQPPTRALGFVAWLDNQYAIATPRGVLRFGATSTPEEWFEIDTIRIDSLI
jgi:hypothetical protein